ncbi:hypothetical protein KPH14_011090 [Odynerus spinipes]|uniref:Uncharacterized protein n=1 Tax=Odynerus spinipes TaxID=1348599 RepID=A0AAD9RHA6_9HYME|nr:hypothetical protein KPH14_011090 [Odynerus spinipes]
MATPVTTPILLAVLPPPDELVPFSVVVVVVVVVVAPPEPPPPPVSPLPPPPPHANSRTSPRTSDNLSGTLTNASKTTIVKGGSQWSSSREDPNGSFYLSGLSRSSYLKFTSFASCP